MNNLDSVQANDKFLATQGSENLFSSSVNMANPTDVHSLFNGSANQNSVVSDGQMSFSNPYGPRHEGQWHGGSERNDQSTTYGGTASGMDAGMGGSHSYAGGDSIANSAPASDSGAGDSTGASDQTGASAGAGNQIGSAAGANESSFEQQLQTELTQLQQSINQISSMLAQDFGSGQPAPSGDTAATPAGSGGSGTGASDNVSASTSTSGASDNVLASTSTSGASDNVSASTSTSGGSDNVSASTSTSGGSDNISTNITNSGGSDNVSASTSTSGGSDNVSASTSTSGGSDNVSASTSTSGGSDNISTATTNPAATSADPLIASLQSSDPTMAQTLTDSAAQLSSQGDASLEQYIRQSYTNPANDAQIMSQAQSQAGLSTADASALQNVLQSDMPSALNVSSNNTEATSSSDTTQPSAQAGNASTNAAANTTNATASGSGAGFQTSSGTLTYNGQALDGVAVTGQYVQQVGAAQAAANIKASFPDANVVRLATSPDGGAFSQGSSVNGGESVADIDQAIQAFNAAGMGVIVDNHQSDASTADNVANTGSEASWFGQIAQDNLGNNNVMYQTLNEVTGPDGGADVQPIVAEQQAAYNAIRATGANNVVAFEADGGNWAGPMQSSPSTYDGDSNYAIDYHQYATNSGTIQQFQQTIDSTVTEANGGQVPVYVGETGLSESSTQTPNAADLASLNAAYTSGNGAVAWLYDGAATGFSDINHLTNPDGSLTPYGQTVDGLIQQEA